MTELADRQKANNIKVNVLSVGARLRVPCPPTSETLSLICYGPSLRQTWKDIRPKTTIATVSGAHDFLCQRGIVPHFHVEFDYRPHKAKHVTKPNPETVFYLASCVNPAVVWNVRENANVLWHAKQGGEHDKTILKLEPNAYLIPGGGSVGLRAIELFYALGYRNFEIHGMDSSFDDEDEWAGPHYGTSRLHRDVIELPCAGRVFKTSVAFSLYVPQFLQCRASLSDATFTFHGDGLMQTAAALTQEKAA